MYILSLFLFFYLYQELSYKIINLVTRDWSQSEIVGALRNLMEKYVGSVYNSGTVLDDVWSFADVAQACPSRHTLPDN